MRASIHACSFWLGFVVFIGCLSAVATPSLGASLVESGLEAVPLASACGHLTPSDDHRARLARVTAFSMAEPARSVLAAAGTPGAERAPSLNAESKARILGSGTVRSIPGGLRHPV